MGPNRVSSATLQRPGAEGFRIPPRLLLGLIIVAVSVISYCAKRSFNPVTGQTQYVGMSMQQEVAMGLNAAPEMAREFGGLESDARVQAYVDMVGQKLATSLRLPPEAPQYPYEFHVLADDSTVNAFALPGGQIFITMALFTRLETEGQLAGVLGHEMGHVLGRHSAARMATGELIQGVASGAGVAGSDIIGMQGAQQASAVVGNMLMLKYGRGDELEADQLGLRFMVWAGYDPRSLIRVMEILREATGGASRQPEFMSTHPDPGNRIERIQQHLAVMFPDGMPEGLKK